MENLFLLCFGKSTYMVNRINKVGDLSFDALKAENGIHYIFASSLFSVLNMSDVIRRIAVDKFSFTI